MARSLLLFALLPSLALAAPFTVVLDPGHGGEKDGAVSDEGVKEKDVVLGIARELRRLLEADGDVRVVLTRDEDVHVPLVDRTVRANEARGDLLVSIHCNSMPTKTARQKTSGIETYFLSADASDAEAQALAARENADAALESGPVFLDPISLILQDLSRSLAHTDASEAASRLHTALIQGLGSKDRGVKQAPFVVLLGAEMPAVLVEVGFISHPSEGRTLAQPRHQAKIAASLHAGIREFRTRVHARRTGEPMPASHSPSTKHHEEKN